MIDLYFVFRGLVLLVLYLFWKQRKYIYGGCPHGRSLRNKTSPPEGGKIEKLSRGDCHYRYDGEGNTGYLVVLVHGFVGCHADYAQLVNYLVKQGRRVLRMDNYGRGWSTLPHEPTNVIPELYAGQLAELLFALGEEGPIDLAGYSMGGGIVAVFAERFPSKVNSLTYLAAAGLPSMSLVVKPAWQRVLDLVTDLPFGMRVVLPLVRKVLSRSADVDYIGWGSDNKPHQDAYLKQFRKRLEVEQQLPYAFISTMKHYPFSFLQEAFSGVARQETPTLAVWGQKDVTVPIECAADLRVVYDSRPTFHEVVLPESTHMLVVEDSKLVGEAMIAFWDKLK